MVGTCGVVKHCFLSYKNYQDYFDRRDEVSNLLSLTKATVTRVQVAGMGDRVCVDLCSLMRPGEGLLVCFHFLIFNSTVMIYYCANRMGCIHLYGPLISQVGSFARGLFLVHSECLESNYIASRPFRVNAVSFGFGFFRVDIMMKVFL